MAEILAGSGIHKALRELDIKSTRTYKGNNEPRYSVWELTKEDLMKLEYNDLEWQKDWGWFQYSKGIRMGSACEILDVRGQMLLGWPTKNGETKFDALVDYLNDGLNMTTREEHCALAVELARANGITMAKLFQTFQG